MQSYTNVIVLHGFDASIIKCLRKDFLDNEAINSDGRIELEKINPTAIMMKIMSSTTTSYLTMESMIAFSSSFTNLDILGKKITILDNNLLNRYINPTTSDIPDFESRDFQNDNKNEVYCNFYSYCEHVDGIQMVNYIEPDLSQSTCISIVPFINPDSLDNIQYLSDETELPILSSDSGTLQSLMESLYYNDSVQGGSYVLHKNVTMMEAYKVLVAAIKLCGADIRLYWKSTPIKQKTIRDDLYNVLREVWGYESFRQLRMYEDLDVGRNVALVSQGDVIETVVSEAENAMQSKDYNNVLLTSPTGAGKSLLFQLAAIYLAKKYQSLTIVVSPLIALMDDQVANLITRYKHVAALNGNKSADETAEILQRTADGDINILYMSPELLLSHSLQSLIGLRKIGLVVIDEAHTVTTWGRDFRVDYWFLGDYLRTSIKYLDYKFPIFALTATAVYDPSRKNDMVFETIESLNMDPCIKYIGVVRRENIVFEIGHPDKARDYEKQRRLRTVDGIINAIENKRKSIFYFPYVRTIGQVLDESNLQPYRIKVTQFHSRLTPIEKQTNAYYFKEGICPIICASKAFGMGVDVSDITEVYHHAPSGCLPDYVQEIGRLARDEKLTGIAKIDFNEQDFKYTRQLHGLSTIKPYQLEEVLKKLMEIYRMRGEKRNMMLSPADFEYIFPDAGDQLEQKFKSSLLLISHDLMRHLNFRAIIVRAKNLFVDMFVELPQNEYKSFYKEYSEFLTPLGINTGRFILHAEKYWTKKNSSISFPQFKSKLANNQIFKKYLVKPIVRVETNLNTDYNVSNAHALLENFFMKSKAFLDKIATAKKGEPRHIKFGELKDALIDCSAIQKQEFLRAFLLAYATGSGNNGNVVYCQVKTTDEEDRNQISLLQHGYDAVRSQLMAAYENYIREEKNEIYCDKDSVYVKLSEIMNSLNIASFQKVGGAEPQVFVRINNPRYLHDLLKRGNYKNKMLADIYEKHKISEQVFTYFFQTDMTDKQRWDFIEAYFLGASMDELLHFAD